MTGHHVIDECLNLLGLRPHFAPEPAELWHFSSERFRELTLEASRSEDDYPLPVNGALPNFRPVRRSNRHHQLSS